MNRKKNEVPGDLYRDRLPEEILRELTPEVRRQYFLWDEIMKREIQLYPELILPVVKEIFHKEYPDDRSIILLSAEYTVCRAGGDGLKLLQAIRSDILMKIAGDLYHFECQIGKDGQMVFRMFEYDVNIAVTHAKTVRVGKTEREKFTVSFPKSAVLYLGNEKRLPEYETCEIRFPDGTKHLYRVPVMRVQEYCLEEIEEKHLNILIPFLVIRFRERIRKVSAKERETVKNEIIKFVQECFMVLGKEEDRAVITEMIRKDIGEFLWKACSYLLEEDEELFMMVRVELEPAIKLSREIIQELEDSNKALESSNRELEDSNKALTNNNRELQQEMGDCHRRLIEKSLKEGKDEEETAADLMTIFSLSREAAMEKMRRYRKENQI